MPRRRARSGLLPVRERVPGRAERLRSRLAAGPAVVLDGAMGTHLAAQGVDITGPLWSTRALEEAPDTVVAAHAEYVRAGAEVITTVTFRAHPGLFAAAGRSIEAWRGALRSGVRAAESGIEAAGCDRDEVWVAGSLAPVGDSYRSDEVPDEEVLRREHGAQAQALAGAGVDLILVETMVAQREARVAVQAARRAGVPVWCSFVVGAGARLLSGESLAAAALEVEALGVQAVLVNCASLENSAQAIAVLQEVCAGPWGVYANGSSGDAVSGWGEALTPHVYARAAGEWLQRGARIVGSCCATGPGHTGALSALVRAPEPSPQGE